MVSLPPAVADFIAIGRVGRLGTADAAGQPHVVPFCYAWDGTALFSAIDAKPKRAAPRALRRIRNIEANPRVRVRAGRRWRKGTATVLPDYDWRALQRRLPSKLSSATVRLMGTDHLTIRVDLDPASGAPRSAGPTPP